MSNKIKEIISLCKGMSCTFNGSEKVHDVLEEEVKKRELEDSIEIVESCCKGMCQEGPNAVLLNKQTIFTQLDETKAGELIEHILED